MLFIAAAAVFIVALVGLIIAVVIWPISSEQIPTRSPEISISSSTPPHPPSTYPPRVTTTPPTAPPPYYGTR
jgi:hypothetical protein